MALRDGDGGSRGGKTKRVAVELPLQVERKRPYVIEAARVRLASDKVPLIVFGRAAQVPFGLISTKGEASRRRTDPGAS